ncbi:hypothetical protein chiPu_0007852 [Chiloscyllium punctatum]|uniref:Uncharacterized protein n=1 Tax=Chiloscyllium punctatum TaxID=137246 RepID=A0A401SGD8_CHIPU|nr:hypothetical protein [Chiloscyllium punctatum]
MLPTVSITVQAAPVCQDFLFVFKMVLERKRHIRQNRGFFPVSSPWYCEVIVCDSPRVMPLLFPDLSSSHRNVSCLKKA